MKKMIKMSLVAAVAVAGLTTTASAGNLEEMIKDTKVNGYVRYQLVTDHENSTDTDEQAKVVTKVTTPVNDMVTANVKMVAGETSTQLNQDTKAAMNITEGNFVINAAGATVIAGLQTSQSPFMANNGDTRSHGVTALVPAGPATIAAAYYTTTTPSKIASDKDAAMTNDVLALGALVKAGPANINLWYATVEDATNVSIASENDGATTGAGDKEGLTAFTIPTDGASAMSVQVTVDAGPVNLDVMHTALDAGNGNEGSLTKAVVTGKAANISYMAAYAMTGDEALGGQVTLDNDSDAVSDLGLDNLSMQAVTDATAFALSAKMQVNDAVCAKIAYLSGDSAGTDFDEMDIKVGYKMSKNFNASVLYAMGDAVGTDFGYSQIEVKYTF